MQGNRNNMTRALVSALRSDLKPLRAAAVALVDEALKKNADPELALRIAFKASRNTAVALLREREKLNKGGNRNREKHP